MTRRDRRGKPPHEQESSDPWRGAGEPRSRAERSAQDGTGRADRFTVRRRVRESGERSAKVASTLVQMPDASVRRLELEPRLREAVDRARTTRTHIARRREERRLARVLRGVDLDALQTMLDGLRLDDGADARLFQLAERWRERLIAEGHAALCEEFPSVNAARMTQLVADARRELASGRPRGARRVLFREVMALLQAAAGD